MEYAGVGALIVLALNIWAILSILGSDASTGAKTGWSLLVLFLPVLGFIIWLIEGPREDTRPADARSMQFSAAPSHSARASGTR